MDAEALKALHQAQVARQNGDFAPIQLSSADLVGLVMPGADLRDAQLRDAELEGATLSGARLSQAVLSGVNLRDADLSGADLEGARLLGADLTGAKLQSAALTGADLRGACLFGIFGEPLSWQGARINQATIERSFFSEQRVRRMQREGAVLESESPARPPRAPQERSRNEPQADSSALDSQADEPVSASLRSYRVISELILETREGELDPTDAKLGLEGAALLGQVILGCRLEAVRASSAAFSCISGHDGDGRALELRIFTPGYSQGPRALAVFRQGLRAFASLSHTDNIQGLAELVAVGSDLSSYVCVDYGGGTLEELWRHQASPSLALKLFRQVAEVVGRLHDHGVLVRTLCPQGIVLDGLQPKLAEIGLVDVSGLGQHRGHLGHYSAYVAPEELRGQGTESPTADIFSLGKLLAFLLTSREPLAGLDTADELPALDGLPDALVQLIARACARDPRERFQYVEELLGELLEVERGHQDYVQRATLRPAVPSRLSLRPFDGESLPRRERQLKFSLPPVGAPPLASLPAEELGPWSRATDYWLAGFGLVLALVFLGFPLLRGASVNSFERAQEAASAFLSLMVLAFPRARRRSGLKRILALLLTFLSLRELDLMPLLRASYAQQVQLGGPLVRERLVPDLVRLGHRHFQGMKLRELNLMGQDLSEVDFRRADLVKTNFLGAMLMGAKFEGAQLGGANFRGADLRQAQILGADDWRSASCDAFTLLSAPLDCEDGRLSLARRE